MFTYNNKTVKAINFNGTPVKVLKYNGIVVWQSSRLPEGYLECEYLETKDNKSYINTGLLINADDVIDWTICYNVNIPQIDSTKLFGLNLSSSAFFWGVSNTNRWWNRDFDVFGDVPFGEWFTIDMRLNDNTKQTTFTFNKEQSFTRNWGSASKAISYPLTSNSLPNGTYTGPKLKFKEFSVIDNTTGEYLFNGIPAFDKTNNKPCLFDLVTNQPFYNAGSGEFDYSIPVPREYTQLEYLESDGEAYIETDLKFGFPVNANGKMHYLGNAVSSNNSVFSPFGSSVTSAYFGIDGTDYWSLGNNVKVSIPYNEILEFQYTKATTSGAAKLTDQNGTSATRSGTLSVANINNMYLFRAGWNSAHDTLSGIKKMRIYYVNVYDNNQACRLVPVKRNSDNELGMYDLVGGQFYANAGGGSFIGGNPI